MRTIRPGFCARHYADRPVTKRGVVQKTKARKPGKKIASIFPRLRTSRLRS